MRGLLLGTAIFFAKPAAAQNKMLSLEDAVRGLFTTYRIDRPQPLCWISDTSFLLTRDFKTLYRRSLRNNEEVVWFTTESLADLKDKSIQSVRRSADGKAIVVELSDRYLYRDPEGDNTLAELRKPKDGAEFHPEDTRRQMAYTIENNVYWLTPQGQELSVTQDVDKGIVNGSGYVHRQEFGIHEGLFWSPDGRRLAFYAKDERMVKEYPLVNTSVRQAEPRMIRYPMAGMKSEEVKLKVFNTETGRTTTLYTNAHPETYLTCVTWAPDGRSIYIALLNRGQDHLVLKRFDAESGSATATLLEERHPKYVEPEHPLLFVNGQPDLFIWQSERDGFNHLYLYNTEGTLVRQLTKGPWEVTDVLGQDPRGEWLYYQATKVAGTDRHLYRVNLRNGRNEALCDEKEGGTWSGWLSPDGRHLLAVFQSATVPPRLELIETATRRHRLLHQATDPLDSLNMPRPQLRTFTAADGKTLLYGRLTLPLNTEPGRRYPVFLYVYGGPHVQLVTNTRLWGAGLLDSYMAQQGFVVLTVDNRGSAHRGLEFENVIHRRLGYHEMQDQVKALREIYALPFVDSTRTVVHGWSFGGFMTISLMLHYPELFKAGAAGGPVTDWKWYEVMYGERYMDTPEENPEGYAATSLLDKVHNLKGRLLIIHGLQDDVVVPQHSLELVEAFIRAGRQVDFFPYPSHAHNVRGKDRLHLMEKVTDYLIRAVKDTP